MPRLRLFRRRNDAKAQDTADVENSAADYRAAIEPFVPVAPEGITPYRVAAQPAVEVPEPQPAPRAARELPRLRRPGFGIRIDLTMLLLAAALIAAGIIATLVRQDRVDFTLDKTSALAILIAAGVWMLAALLRQQMAPFLGGAAAAGVGLALLLDVEDIASFQETVLGVVLVTVGLGIVIRGILIRPASV